MTLTVMAVIFAIATGLTGYLRNKVLRLRGLTRLGLNAIFSEPHHSYHVFEIGTYFQLVDDLDTLLDQGGADENLSDCLLV